MLLSVALVLAVGCGDPGPVLPADPLSSVARDPRELEPAQKVGAADFDGDGSDEVVLISDGVARWGGHAIELGGEVQVVRRGDPDGDGHEVLLLGTGMGRTARSAETRIWSLGQGGAELLFQRKVTRNQVADIDFLGERIWLALFGQGKTVEAGWLEGRQFQAVESRELATTWLPLGEDRRVVGRVYGDVPRAPGDLRVVGPEGERTLPSLRGVRSLAAMDLDGDGHDELLVGDGWHYSYGKQGIGRVRLLEGPDWETGRTIAMFDGEYTAWSLEVVGDRILATGNRHVHLLTRDALGWSDVRVSPVTETGNAVAFRDGSGWWALVSGSPARLVPLD